MNINLQNNNLPEIRNVFFNLHSGFSECVIGDNWVRGKCVFVPNNLNDQKLNIEARINYVHFSPLNTDGQPLKRLDRKSFQIPRSIHITQIIESVFEEVILINDYPYYSLYLLADVLLMSGGSRCTVINCIMHNLINERISCTGVCSAIAFGVDDKGIIHYDLTAEDEHIVGSDIPVVFKFPTEQILHISIEADCPIQCIEEGLLTSKKLCKNIVEKINE